MHPSRVGEHKDTSAGGLLRGLEANCAAPSIALWI
jgi:hypothetical protein